MCISVLVHDCVLTCLKLRPAEHCTQPQLASIQIKYIIAIAYGLEGVDAGQLQLQDCLLQYRACKKPGQTQMWCRHEEMQY